MTRITGTAKRGLRALRRVYRQSSPHPSVKQAASQELYEKALALRREGKIDQALEAFEEAAEVYPKNLQAQLERGRIYVRRGDWAKARDAFDRAEDVDPRDPDILYHLGRAEWELGRHGKARKWWNRTIALKPDDARALYGLGLYALEDGEPAEAERDFAQALQAEPNHAAAAWHLAHLRLDRADRVGARSAFEQALAGDDALAPEGPTAVLYLERLTPEERADAHYRAGILAFEAGKAEPAETQLSQAVALGTHLPPLLLADAHFRLSLIYMQAARAAAAEEHLRADVALDPSNAEAFHRLGLLRFGAQDAGEAGRFFLASTRLEGSIALFGGDATAHLFLALTLEDEARPDAAVQEYARARALGSAEPEAFARQGALLYARGDLAGAQEALGRAVALKADHARSHYLLGRIAYGQDRLDPAIHELEAALRTPAPPPPFRLGDVPDSSPVPPSALPDLHWRLAMADDRTHEPRSAELHFRAHLKLLPDPVPPDLVAERDEARYRMGLLTYGDGRLSTVGIEDPAGTSGVLYAFDQAGALASNQAILFGKSATSVTFYPGAPSSVVPQVAGPAWVGNTLLVNYSSLDQYGNVVTWDNATTFNPVVVGGAAAVTSPIPVTVSSGTVGVLLAAASPGPVTVGASGGSCGLLDCTGTATGQFKAPGAYVTQVVPFAWDPAADLGQGTSFGLGGCCTAAGGASFLPFAFSFYVTPYRSFWASTSGLSRLDALDPSTANVPFPVAGTSTALAPFWSDLSLPANGDLRWGVAGTAPAERFVVTWTNAKHNACADAQTFQEVLYQGSNLIRFNYRQVQPNAACNGPETIGLNLGDGISGNGLTATSAYSGLSILWTP